MNAKRAGWWHQFMAELRRRRVFRPVAVYGAAAFLAMQAADLIFPRVGLPDWSVTLVVVIALLGVPVAFALAWIFERSGHGLRRTLPATPDMLATAGAQLPGSRWSVMVATMAAVALVGVGAWIVLAQAQRPSYDSIAVLPFTNLSGQPENDYFGDGLAEELINALAGIEGLRVAARTSAFAFKGTNTDVRVIGDTLNVAAVLEGSVRRSGGRIRITAQLTDARSGYNIWNQSYDRPLADLFSVQDAIASEIVAALTPRLRRSAARELYRGGTGDVAAYDLYLLGRQKWVSREIPLLREAVAHFEAAIARDSSFALAWSGLADALYSLAFRSAAEHERAGEARYAAQRAIMLDSEMAEGWASLGVLALDFDQDWRVGELALRRAIQLKPSYAVAHQWLSDLLRITGRIDEALLYARRAATLDPLASFTLVAYAQTLYLLGRTVEARELFLRFTAGNIPPTLGMVTHARDLGFSADEAAEYASEWARRFGLSRVEDAALVGRAIVLPELRSAARRALRRMEQDGRLPLRDRATLSTAIADYDRAVDLLEQSLERREPMPAIAVDPLFDPVRQDARFTRILTALHLPNCGASCRAAAAARAAR